MSDKPVSDKPRNVGLSLFPPEPKKTTNPSRRPSTRRHPAVSPQSPPDSGVEASTAPAWPLDGRQSALDGRQSALGGRQTPQSRGVSPGPRQTQPESSQGRQTPQSSQQTTVNGRQTPSQANASTGRQTPQSSPPKGRQTPQSGRETPQQGRRTPAAERVSPIAASPQAEGLSIPRSHTSFSEAPTLVRRDSNASNAEPTNSTTTTAFPREEPVIRSIFPTYHPEIPLEHQPYFPTQTSPAHIPKTVINRRQYSPSVVSGRSAAGLQSPLAIGAAAGRFPRGVQDETIMEPSTNEEMKELWKVVNGWRVSSSEGRSFCLKMTSDAEEPVHTLSSASQPFYTLRLIPTSTSAQMTMTRLDPNKPIKENGSPKLPSSSKPNTGTEVMSTTLEEEARRLPPNDGLVALLYPRAASNMAIDLINRANRSDAEQVLAAAERECGRLVWDEDSRKYYLVHPALSTPFVISITSSPAWSRVEYTLEHSELPRNIVRLVRDGAGSGYLEVDTGVAAKIDCFYVVDVAICAIMLVAIAEEKTKNVERFDAPPSVGPASPMSLKFPKMPKKAKKADRKSVTMEEFEMDLESQNSVSLKKEKVKVKKQKEGDEKVPGFFGLCWMLVKCFFWVIGMFFKALWKCMVLFGKGITYCCRSHK